jgi:SAM-dependent methyltransferase
MTTEQLAAVAKLRPDANPNRFLSGADWNDRRYRALMDEFASIYQGEMGGQPHPFGSRNPDAIVTHWSREWEYPWAVLNAGLAPGMRAVDLGCGGSPLLPYLSRRAGCLCTGVELKYMSTTGTHTLRGFVREPSELYPDITWLVESMAELSLGDGTQDRVFCISVLEHVGPEVARGTMAETFRVLRPGGRALITTDVDGAHRTLTSTYEELIEMAREAGLRMRGEMDSARPRETPGTYDVVGFVLEKPR